MPLFDLKCEKCDKQIEVRESHEAAKNHKCESCGETMKIVPSSSLFKIEGYSMANGYHRETINYDGSGG